MNVRNFRRTVLLIGILLFALTACVNADEQQIKKKLDRDIKIQLNNVTIAEALEKIGEKAGIEIVLSFQAEWKLPQGKATMLSVALDGPLSESLKEMLNAFFMRYAVGEDKLTIYPRPELDHIIGRPNTKQLELLKKIYQIKFTLSGEITDEVLLRFSKQRLGDVVIQPSSTFYHFEKIVKRMTYPEGSLPLTFSILLEQIREGPWYISGMEFPNEVAQIRVVSEKELREAKLNQLIDITFKEQKAIKIIKNLTSMADMELMVRRREPSWLEGNIAVSMQNTTLRQALRNVIAMVDGDIRFDMDDKTIRIEGPLHREKQTSEKKDKLSGVNYVGKISIPMDGGAYYIEFMLRETDLTEQLKKLREQKLQEILSHFESPKK